MSKGHVCLIGPIPPPWGGVETHMMGLRETLLSNGIRCSVVNVTRHRQPDHDDLYFPNSARALISRLSALKPDIVHVHFGGSLFARQAALFVLLSLRWGSRNVFTFHSGGFPSSKEGRRASWFSLRGFALRTLDAVIGVNQELVDTFARYGVRKNRLHLISPFAAGLDRAAVVKESLPENIRAFAEQHSPLLVTVAQLEPEYGIDIQLEAFDRIRQQHPNAGLAILGGGSLRDSLEQQVAAHASSDHLLLAGNVPRPKTLALIARADLLLRTTHYDGDALSIREALAVGTRVLASRTALRPEGVHLLDALDAATLASAIQPALNSSRPVNTNSIQHETNPMETVVALYKSLRNMSNG
ncbi:MAG: glycosyltransferase family 4 protein [Gemmatimonadaceae bacterium]